MYFDQCDASNKTFPKNFSALDSVPKDSKNVYTILTTKKTTIGPYYMDPSRSKLICFENDWSVPYEETLEIFQGSYANENLRSNSFTSSCIYTRNFDRVWSKIKQNTMVMYPMGSENLEEMHGRFFGQVASVLVQCDSLGLILLTSEAEWALNVLQNLLRAHFPVLRDRLKIYSSSTDLVGGSGHMQVKNLTSLLVAIFKD